MIRTVLLAAALVLTPPSAHVSTFKLRSAAVGKRLPVTVVVPGGAAAAPRPLLVFLHGRSTRQDAYLSPAFFAALGRLRSRAPVVAFPYGGDHSYWHDRHGRRWARYVVSEAIPRVVGRFGVDGSRVAIGGISMGGFGAYDIARLHPGRFCAVGGHSPALWRSSGETAPGAFDDARDFSRHDVIRHPGGLAHLPVWLDAGDRDPFQPGDGAFAAALRRRGADLVRHTWPGGHDGAYWDRHWRSYLRFYADALAAC